MIALWILLVLNTVMLAVMFIRVHAALMEIQMQLYRIEFILDRLEDGMLRIEGDVGRMHQSMKCLTKEQSQ